MFNRLIRYLPVLDYIRKYRPKKILEVGSGSKGLGEFWDGKFWGADVEFPEPTVSNMKPVRLSENSENSDKPENQKDGKSESQKFKLPFENGSFDLVVCMDTLEHVAPARRPGMIKEMMRVCWGKTLIIGYPCGAGAAELSGRMLKWYQKRGSGSARWMMEHAKFGLPNLEFENTISKESRSRPRHLGGGNNNENLFVCELLLKLEDFGRWMKFERFVLAHFRPLVEFFLRRVNFGKCYRKIRIITE